MMMMTVKASEAAASMSYNNNSSSNSNSSNNMRLYFHVGDMTCASCALRISKALLALDGVVEAQVSYMSQSAEVVIKDASVAATVYALVEHMGYSTDGSETTPLRASSSLTPLVVDNIIRGSDDEYLFTHKSNLDHMQPEDDRLPIRRHSGGAAAAGTSTLCETRALIEGMSCTSCAARIESTLSSMDGISKAEVNFAMMTGVCTHNATVLPVPQLLQRVAEMGYTPSLLSTTSDALLSETDDTGDDTVVVVLHEDGDTRRIGGSPREGVRRAKGAGHRFQHRILIEGMSCASCAARIENALLNLAVVVSCSVSFATGSAAVTTIHGQDDAIDLVKTLQGMGYAATVLDATGGAAGGGGGHGISGAAAMDKTRAALERTAEIERHKRLCIGSAILSIPLAIAMIIMSVSNIMMEHRVVGLFIDGIQLLCATPIVVYYGRQFFVGAYRSFLHRTYTMDTLVAIGTGCSYVYSVVAFAVTLLTGAHMMTYFDTAGMLTSFMLLGRYLEANAKRSTSGALIELMNLVPPMAIVVSSDGDVRVPSSSIRPGAHVRVLAGDRIPVDGTIVEGFTDIDEQMVTGESVPKNVRPGDAVVGGTLNLTATMVMVADKVGDDTMLSQILRIVQEAQNTKPAVQRVADRIAMYFVPFVVCCSLLTLLTWLVLGLSDAYPAHWRHGMPWEAFAFNFFIATVVAACPCALGLATPTAIMVGTGVGAKNGVLVKSGVTLETVRLTDCVLFDKTGTITNGRMQVVWQSCVGVEGGAAAERLVRRLVGAVEAQSTHPIAKAVSAALLKDSGASSGSEADNNTNNNDGGEEEEGTITQVDVVSATTHPGKGVEAVVAVTRTQPDGQRVQEHAVLVGNLKLLSDMRCAVPPSLEAMVQQRSAQGHTTVVGAVDGRACIVISLADEPKLEAYGVLQELQRQGLRTLMVTGDNRHVAACIARQVGIAPEDTYAESLPATKAAVVQELQAEGYRVMFVGDGINDSPALAQADVGVALGGGTEIAMEAADAVLMRNSLVDLLNLRALSVTTVRRIYGNFIWALGYNLVMLPIASGLLFPFLHVQLPPVMAGAAMVLSSLSVLASSLSLRCFRPYREEQFVVPHA